MSRYLSEEFKAARAKIDADYGPESTWVNAKKWWKRVGRTRLVADEVAGQASSLLHDLNPNTFRTDPEIRDLLYEAREAVRALHVAIVQENWRRYDEGEK